MKNIPHRIFFDSALLLSVFVAPFPVTIVLGVVGLFSYPRYGEAVIAAVVVELLYRGKGSDVLGSHLLLAVWVLLALFIIEMLRTVVRERTR